MTREEANKLNVASSEGGADGEIHSSLSGAKKIVPSYPFTSH